MSLFFSALFSGLGNESEIDGNGRADSSHANGIFQGVAEDEVVESSN